MRKVHIRVSCKQMLSLLGAHGFSLSEIRVGRKDEFLSSGADAYIFRLLLSSDYDTIVFSLERQGATVDVDDESLLMPLDEFRNARKQEMKQHTPLVKYEVTK